MHVAKAELLPLVPLALSVALIALLAAPVPPHGTVVTPISRVYRVYQSNPQNPNFALAANAVAIDGATSYYTWNELSRNIPQAVAAGLPPGFDYSPWIPNGQLASAGRVDPLSTQYPRTYAGLDQVSAAWPTTTVTGGATIPISFLATAPHNPSVWDVWMTTPNWDASTPLRWSHMEFLGRPTVTFTGTHYQFQLTVPSNRMGHHVLWVVWQRNDPVGEAFFSTSDILVRPANDECAGAVPITLGETSSAALPFASPSPQSAACESGGKDLWFRYTAACTGTLRADTCATASGVDTAVSIWSGACGSLAEIGCNNNSCGVLSAATASVVAGNTYFIKVRGQAGTQGTVQLTVSYANGTGSFTTSSAGCGGASLNATGAPNLGGIVDFSVSGHTGALQALLLGFSPSNLPACPGCLVGTSIDAMLPPRLQLLIPCDPGLIGSVWWLQGVDAVGATGGCQLGGIDFRLTDTIRTQVGG